MVSFPFFNVLSHNESQFEFQKHNLVGIISSTAHINRKRKRNHPKPQPPLLPPCPKLSSHHPRPPYSGPPPLPPHHNGDAPLHHLPLLSSQESPFLPLLSQFPPTLSPKSRSPPLLQSSLLFPANLFLILVANGHRFPTDELRSTGLWE
jgi:hypothetical protein